MSNKLMSRVELFKDAPPKFSLDDGRAIFATAGKMDKKNKVDEILDNPQIIDNVKNILLFSRIDKENGLYFIFSMEGEVGYSFVAVDDLERREVVLCLLDIYTLKLIFIMSSDSFDERLDRKTMDLFSEVGPLAKTLLDEYNRTHPRCPACKNCMKCTSHCSNNVTHCVPSEKM